MMKLWMLAVLTCISNMYASMAWGQTDTTFWFVAPEVTDQSFWDRPIYLRVSTYGQPATVTITQPANGGMPDQTMNIAANSSQSINLTTWINVIENKPPNTVLNYGLKIRSTAPVTAYYDVVGSTQDDPEAFVLKGKNALGVDFWIPSQNMLDNESVPYTAFDIVATQNNTTVTITPSNNIMGHTAGTPFTITLNEGQTYSAAAVGHAAADHLQGSRVISDKPIAITVKDDRLIGTPFGGCMDLAGDQIVPSNVVGTEYVAMKGLLAMVGDQVFITATQNGTTISKDGTLVTTINAGQTYQLAIGGASTYIQTSQPVYVWQLSGIGCEVGAGLLPKINCTGSSSIAYTRSTNRDLYFNILVESGGQGNFSLNGNTTTVTAGQFNVVPGTGGQWYAAQVLLPITTYPQNGAILITNSSSKFHLAVLDGGPTIGTSYGYFSDFGSVISRASSADTVVCMGGSMQFFGTGVAGATYSWSGPNGFSSTQQNPVVTNITTTGWYKLTTTLNACISAVDSVLVKAIRCDPVILNADSTTLTTVYCFENVNHEIIGVPGGGYFWGCGIVDSGGKVYFNPALAAYGAGSFPHKCIIRYMLPTGEDTIYVMTVNRPVIPDAGLDQTVCHNSFVLSATANYNHLQYAWAPAADLNTPGEPVTGGSTNAAVQTYTVTATDITTGCIGKDSATIFNNTLTASFTMSRDSICSGDTVLFTSTTTGPNPILLWSLGDGDTSALTSFLHTYTKGGRYIIQLSVNNTLCRDTTQDTLYVFDRPVDSMTLHLSDSIICTGGSIMVDAYIPAGYSGIAWDFGDGYQPIGNTSFRKGYDKEGTFIIRVRGLYTACPALDTAATITVIAAPIVDIGLDTSICPGDPGIVLRNLHMQSGAYSNLWSTGETSESITVHQPGTYYLTVLSGGCATTDTVEVKPGCYIAIPNVYSPNGDGVNDYFFPRQILARGVRVFHMYIYNRWGEVIYETTSTTGRGWDGTYNDQPQPEGVYVYVIDVTYINGINERYKGNVTLLR